MWPDVNGMSLNDIFSPGLATVRTRTQHCADVHAAILLLLGLDQLDLQGLDLLFGGEQLGVLVGCHGG